MIRIYIILLASIMFFSCKNNTKNINETNIDNILITNREADNFIDINKFNEQVADFVNKEVIFEGTCIHICKHDGGKMHLIGNNAADIIIIIASKESGKFNKKLEGSKVQIVGKVLEERIDSLFIDNKEAAIVAGNDLEIKGRNSKHKNNNLESDAERREMQLMHIDQMRKELKESGKPYLSNYKIECISFKEILGNK